MNLTTPRANFLRIPALNRIQGTLRLPGSKSITNRALLLAALARGETRLRHLLWSDDTRYMAKALESLGLPKISFSEDRSEAVVSGQGGAFPAKKATLFLGNSGTSIRFLAAAVSLGEGEFGLSGEKRMTERPIGDLVRALGSAGANIGYDSNIGYPPITVHAKGLPGGEISIRGDVSSQFLTAILLSAPYCQKALAITVDGELVSKPYVSMTLRMMEQFGVRAHNDDFKRFLIPTGIYAAPGDYEIEGDASSASYALAGAAIAGGSVRLLGLDKKSIQGDVRFTDILREMGAEISLGDGFVECRRRQFPLRAIDRDLSAIPDAAMTVAVLALFADGTSRIRGIKSWKVKETDRIAAMKNELSKTGARVEADDDSITIAPPDAFKPATFETYRDHRMAMCMSLAAFGGMPVTILDPSCVNKTYPDYWKDFGNLVGVPLLYTAQD